MNQFKKLMILIVAITLIGHVLIYLSYAHEHGHAEGINHLKGSRTPGIDKYEGCGKQNKILLYHDIDNDGTMDICSTLWGEHGTIHIIVSTPDEEGYCDCEGYVVFDEDNE